MYIFCNDTYVILVSFYVIVEEIIVTVEPCIYAISFLCGIVKPLFSCLFVSSWCICTHSAQEEPLAPCAVVVKYAVNVDWLWC